METQALNKKIGKATAWSSITEIVAKLIVPIINIILARLLVPSAFGAVATVTMVITFAEIFSDAGFQKYIIQHEFDSEDKLNKSSNVAFWTNLFVSFIIVAIICVFRGQIATLVGNPELKNAIAVATILIVLVALSSIQIARCKRDLDFKTLFFARIGSSLIPLLVTIPLALILRNFWALLIGNFASQGFTALFVTIKSKWRPKFFYNFKLFKEMFSFSAWTLLESVSIWLTVNVDIFIVGRSLSEHYLGIYKTSMTVVNSYVAIITGAITPVIFSALSRYQNDEKQFKKTYYNFQRYAAILIIPMCVGVFVFRDFVTQILLGSQWSEASLMVGLWGLTSIFSLLFSSEIFRSKGKPLISLLLQVSHIIAIVAVVLLFINKDFSSLCIARAIIRTQITIFALIILKFAFKFKLLDIFKNVLPSLISALIMGAVGYGLLFISDSLIWQLASVLICIIVYFISYYFIDKKTCKTCLDKVKSIIHKK